MQYQTLYSKPLKKEDIRIEIRNGKRRYSQDVENLIDKVWNNLLKESNRFLFNGSVVSMLDYKVINSVLVLEVQETDYKSYIATNIHCFDRFENKNEMANVLAACVLPITKDDYCLVGKRSEKLAEGKQQWHIIGGTLEYSHETLCPYELIYKELNEEVNIDSSMIERLECTGFGLTVCNNKPEFTFYARLNISLSDLQETMSSAKDFEEHSEYRFISIDEISDFIRQNNFTPIGKFAIRQYFKTLT